MPPPRNLARRQALTDAAIEILGTAGIHELSHRAVDRYAGVPAGTASNYFRSRDELLAAAAHRVLEVHAQDMCEEAEGAGGDAAQSGAPDEPDPERLAHMLGAALYRAVTRRRIRALAVYELTLEATRRPALAQAMAQLGTAGAQAALGGPGAHGLPATPEQARALMTLVGGALLSLATVPAEELTAQCALDLARCIVAGVLAALPAPRAEVGAAAAGTGQ
ncbi:MAG TPA: TetR family transcriptional regulator [Actinocrinis sp.]|jgi:DNA-binding transcriptional regulator YbjK